MGQWIDGVLAWLERNPAVFFVAVIAGLVGFAALTMEPSVSPAPAPTDASSAAPKLLSAEAVAECRAFLAKADKAGLIVERPSPHRLNVEERLWAQLYARERDLTLQAVSCDLWQTSMPPGFDQFVVVYGAHSGKRIAMLTTAGMDRD